MRGTRGWMMADTRPIILVVDDEPEILITIERLLSRLMPECTILTAPDADSALALLSAHPVRVALIDYRLPGIDGLELAGPSEGRRMRCS
jgi:CheY-like chemotaxis protein